MRTVRVGWWIVCAALWRPDPALAADETFVNDIAPILNRSCVGCHRPGDATPMSLVGYENVRPWVRSIRQRVVARQMPPGTADPASSLPFANDPSLSRDEIDRIARWIDAGAPRGAGAEPAPPARAAGWADASGRPPDYVLALPAPSAVPAASAGASAGVLNPTFYVKVPFDADRWIRAVQGRPDQRSVVHYMDLNIVEFPVGTASPAPVVQATGPSVIGAGHEIDFLTANYRPGYGYEAFPSTFGFWFASAAPATEIVKAPLTAGVVTADGKTVFNKAVAAPGQPGGDMFMPVMQYSVAAGAVSPSTKQP